MSTIAHRRLGATGGGASDVNSSVVTASNLVAQSPCRNNTTDRLYESFEERAGIVEFESGVPRADAEAQAIRELYDVLRAEPADGMIAELAKACRLLWAPGLAPILRALGLDAVRAPAWGFDHVVWGNGTYRPAGPDVQGEAAFICLAIENGIVADLVATRLDGKLTASRCGVARILGVDEIERAYREGRSLLVFNDARSWLRGNRLGVVVVDWARIADAFDGLSALLCGSQAIAERLDRVTAHYSQQPIIGVVERASHAA